MKKSNADQFLDAYRESAEMRTYMKENVLPRETDPVKALLAVAGHFGWDLSEAELEAAYARRAEAARSAARTAESAVTELSPDEMAMVSGGKKGKDECLDTYRDRENCWYTDGCDVVNKRYDDYQCDLTENSSCLGNHSSLLNTICTTKVFS